MYEETKGISKLVPTTFMATKFNNNEKLWKQQDYFCILVDRAYKSLSIPSPYVKLTKRTMWKWLTKDGMLNEIIFRLHNM
jgi:hypothetical protein